MRAHGFTMIEALVSLTLLVTVLSLGVGYFKQNIELTHKTQANSEVQDRVRTVMQVMVSELQLAGSSRYVATDGTTTNNLSCSSSTCLSGTSGFNFSANGTETTAPESQDYLRLRYVTSSRAIGESCRRVDFLVINNGLRRSDLACSASLFDAAMELLDNSNTLADNILALDIRYVCSNGKNLNDYPDAECPAGTSFPRSVLISIVGRSAKPYANAVSKQISTVTGQTVTCPAGYVCYAMTQQVLMPNLKDQ